MEPPAIQPKRREVRLTWNSPSRLFKKRDKEYFTNVGAIVFLIYVLSTVPPEEVTHTITNLGIESVGHFYRWEELAEFWFEDQWGQTMLIIKPLMGTRLIILLGSADAKKIRELVAEHIPFREQPEKTWVDNAASWLSKKVPLEKPS